MYKIGDRVRVTLDNTWYRTKTELEEPYSFTGEITLLKVDVAKVLPDGDYDYNYDYYPLKFLKLIE